MRSRLILVSAAAIIVAACGSPRQASRLQPSSGPDALVRRTPTPGTEASAAATDVPTPTAPTVMDIDLSPPCGGIDHRHLTPTPATPLPTVMGTEVLDIAEAIYRYQFAHYSPTEPQTTYYLRLLGADPPPVLLDRFRDERPVVLEGSRFRQATDGVLFRVDRMARVASNRIESEGGWYVGPLGASWECYVTERQNGRWVVTDAWLLGMASRNWPAGQG